MRVTVSAFATGPAAASGPSPPGRDHEKRRRSRSEGDGRSAPRSVTVEPQTAPARSPAYTEAAGVKWRRKATPGTGGCENVASVDASIQGAPELEWLSVPRPTESSSSPGGRARIERRLVQRPHVRRRVDHSMPGLVVPELPGPCRSSSRPRVALRAASRPAFQRRGARPASYRIERGSYGTR